MANLLPEPREARFDDAVTTLLARDPARHVSLDQPWAVADLLRELDAAGASDAVTTLLVRDPAGRDAATTWPPGPPTRAYPVTFSQRLLLDHLVLE